MNAIQIMNCHQFEINFRLKIHRDLNKTEKNSHL